MPQKTTKYQEINCKNGRPELISPLQYMKETGIRNPEILVHDKRIKQLDEMVTEVKESEECPKGQTLGGSAYEHLFTRHRTWHGARA